MNGFLRERKIVAEVGCVGPPTPILPSLGYPEARATGAGALWQLLQCTLTCSWRTSLPSPQHYCSAAQPTHRPTRRIRLSLRASGQRPRESQQGAEQAGSAGGGQVGPEQKEVTGQGE